MAMVPKLRGRSFMQPHPPLPDQWALMAAATIQEQDRLFAPTFEDRVSGAKDALKSGTFDPRGINSMKDFEGKFETPLSKKEESDFRKWKERWAPNDSGEDYDLRGAFKAGVKPGRDGHWPDTYKKPNHPTFSNESIYAKMAPERAGRWEGDTFIPPEGNR